MEEYNDLWDPEQDPDGTAKVLWDKYYERILFFTVSCARDLDEQEIQDITNDSLFKLLRNCPAWIKTSVEREKWLYTVARNAAYDALRRKKRITKFLSNPLLKNNPVSQEHYDPREGDETVFQNILEEIDKMEEPKKTVLRLFYLEGYTGDEIAEILQLSRQTVYNYNNNVLNFLRSKFAAKKQPDKK